MKDSLRKFLDARLLTLILCTVVVAYILPRQNTTNYHYEVGRPWNYSLLTAPFNIPIVLDEAGRQAAIDSVDRRFVPIYKLSAEVDTKVEQDFLAALNAIPSAGAHTRRHLQQLIRRLYADGVVSESDYTNIATGKLPNVRFISAGNVVETRSTQNMRSLRQAYEWLKKNADNADEVQCIEQSKVAAMLTPNVSLDEQNNQRLLNEQYQRATAPAGVIQQGERIIDRGDIVTEQLGAVLKTYEQMLDERGASSANGAALMWLGKLLYVGGIFLCLALFLLFFRPRLWADPRVTNFLAPMMSLFVLFVVVMEKSFVGGAYIVPLSMIPIMIIVFFDGRTAMFVSLLTTLLTAPQVAYPLEFIVMQTMAAVVAINSLNELVRRSQLLHTAVLVYVAYAVSYAALHLMLTGELSALSARVFGFTAINVVFVSFAYVLIFVVERIYGFTSPVALVELSDFNQPVLQELSSKCPGTFEHSIAVSHLAAEAAGKIGANVHLVRAGALYHDIGKMDSPAFFTENQHGVNPHDGLDPVQSARVITGHVPAGLRRAEKAGLPPVIRNFIAQHHGRGTARYFYLTECNRHPGETVDPAPFTYIGPNPNTRETSILMMADAVEAASRSLADNSPEQLRALVDRIIDTQISEGLHSDSPLSFRDVSVIKQAFYDRLRTIYHSRIAYPDKK
jgi:hypothetical protein